jgi:hypothetical protein
MPYARVWSAQFAPRVLLVIAAVHVVIGVTAVPFRELVGAGFVGAAGTPAREAAFWFAAAGVGLAALAELARWTVQATGRLPARFGAWLLGLGVLVILAYPVSGGWALAALGVLALLPARAAGTRRAPAAAPAPRRPGA